MSRLGKATVTIGESEFEMDMISYSKLVQDTSAPFPRRAYYRCIACNSSIDVLDPCYLIGQEIVCSCGMLLVPEAQVPTLQAMRASGASAKGISVFVEQCQRGRYAPATPGSRR